MKKFIISYLKPRKFEKSGSIYAKIGVRHFLKITPFELRARFTGVKRKTIRSRKDLNRYFRDTIIGELTHFFSFIFVVLVSIYIALTGGWWVAIILTFINVPGNLYPIFLMRYNRYRLIKSMGITIEEGLETALGQKKENNIKYPNRIKWKK